MPVLTKTTILALLPFLLAAAPADEPLPVGRRVDAWEVSDWLNSKPLTPQELRGQVVLVRWWTADGCPFCAATAPALNDFHARYKDRGLVVIGLYHHKVSTPLKVAKVKEVADKFGFRFPVAIDHDWRTLKRWWLTDKERWTSVTFLIDRQGVVRHVHPGGAYVKGDRAYRELETRIEELLKEKGARRP